MLSLHTQASAGAHNRGFLDPGPGPGSGCDDCIKRTRPPDGEHSEQRKKLALMPPPRPGLVVSSPASALHRECSFEFLPNPTPVRPATSNTSSGSRSLEEFRATPPANASAPRPSTSEITFGFGSTHPANPHSGANVYEEAATDDLNLQVGPYVTLSCNWSLSPLVPLADPIQPQPAPDPDSNVFKPEPMLHLNGQAMQHLSILKAMRAKVVHALHHRISRRVSAGKLTQQAADAMQKISASRLVKPVSIALQRYCEAKRYFAESQSCLSHIALSDGSGALGLFTKDVDAITESLANSIAKAAVQGEAALAQAQQQQQAAELNQHDESPAAAGPTCGRLLDESAGPGALPAVGQSKSGLAPLACRRPPTQAPHRFSFCGPRSRPGNSNSDTAPAAVDVELFGVHTLPSTPRSSNAGESGEPCQAASRLTPSPQPMRPPAPSGQELGLQDSREGVQQDQSTDAAAPLLGSRQSCSSSSLWMQPQQQQPQQQQLERLGSGVLGAARTSSVVSCVSPPHLFLSSAESPHARSTGQEQASSGEGDADHASDLQRQESWATAAPAPDPADLVASSSVSTVQAAFLAAAPAAEVRCSASPGDEALQSAKSSAADAGATFSAEPKSALADAMASTFAEGSESVDWFVVVQDVYGVDPEELLLQQQGLEEDQEVQVEQQKQIWTNIRAPTRH